jgi:hypothetical protein
LGSIRVFELKMRVNQSKMQVFFKNCQFFGLKWAI